MKVEVKETEKVNGESDTEYYSETYTYKYGNLANPAKQLPYYMGYEITGTEEFGGLFSVLGLFGYGPSNLPTGYTRTETEEDHSPHTNSYTLSFTMNSNGTIASETRNGKTFVYNYSPTRSAYTGTQGLMQYILSIRSGLFRHKRQ